MNTLPHRSLYIIMMAAIFVSGTVYAQNKSVYTSLSVKACTQLRSNPDEGGDYEGECPGVGGYKLRLIEGNLRQTINIIDPMGKIHELNFWNLTGAFSSVGDTAEWRMLGKKPIALIVRLNVSEYQDDGSSKNKGYLVVAKITPEATCVTDFLAPTRSHNYEARKAADKAVARPCRFESKPD